MLQTMKLWKTSAVTASMPLKYLGGEVKMSDNDEEMSENEGLDVNRHARNTTATAGSKKKHRTAKGRGTTCFSTCKRINCLVGKYG